ncbi:MAG TPA: putative PEP-binding protein, partial [Ignavibacteriaceae bacterium]|nr:putative PEP-binding protein [Ignavibacteriaceae bacterium]
LTKTLDAQDSPVYQTYASLMKWADNLRRLNIRTNADQPDQAANAVAFGAEGIGLCRTEHMFFGGDRIMSVRKMIVAETTDERKSALNELLPLQREDFFGIFKEMKGLPVTIRTLDPPLHEFLPHEEKEIRELADQLNISIEKLTRKIHSLAEFNPMLGFRGCRLGVVFPEITEMQARAIFEAAYDAVEQGYKVKPEIMIPLVGDLNEFRLQEKIVRKAADDVAKERGKKISYLVGTMIELPRACVTADEIAQGAEFFSFGTNDLTQTTFGFSRDDAGKFLPLYVQNEILPNDPFEVLDLNGVGQLVKMGTEKGRSTRENLKVGICGEHGGEPGSVEFCHRIGLNYVSCSPFRVPIARLAAARAVVHEMSHKTKKSSRSKKSTTKKKK